MSCTPNPVNHGGTSTCTATPKPGYTFKAWSGACTGASCVLSNVTAAKAVTATFTLKTYAIAASVSPAAGGTVSCAPNPVNHGGTSTCTATAKPGYTFQAWSGDCTGASCVLSNVTAAKAVTATFTLNTYAIAASVSPAAGGTVSCTPNPVNHGGTSTCTATPTPGYTFQAWSGACTGASCVLSNVTAAKAVTATFTGPTLRINDVSKSEGNSGPAAITFTVSLSKAASAPITVQYATANGTATAGGDFTAASGTLTIPAGQISGTVTVNVAGDATLEPNETFFVNLSGPSSGATLADAQGLGTILNDDGPVLKITDASRAEGNTGVSAFTFTATLTPASARQVTVKYATANGTALAGSDYTAASGTLTFAPGQTSKTVTVNVSGDTAMEANEAFAVNLFGPTGATLFDSQGLGTILNDDGPVLRIGDVSKAEGNAGTSASNFTVTLSRASAGSVTVKYATVNGTAAAGSDYTATSGTLTFAPGQTSKSVAVTVLGDTVVEANEAFIVDLSAPAGATLFDARGVGTITNDD